MTNDEKKCRDLCAELVRLCGIRGPNRCELCGSTYKVAAHHPFGRRCHWSIKFDPRLGVCLCSSSSGSIGCHEFYDKDLDGLLAELIPVLRLKDDERAELLEGTAKVYKRLKYSKPNFKRIYVGLKQFERDHAGDWMDIDIEPEYGRII